jgi:hypothetical protein
MRNPYEVLGVSGNASAAEIKRAFRERSRDLDKREAFDRGKIDAEAKPHSDDIVDHEFTEVDDDKRTNQGERGFGGFEDGSGTSQARGAPAAGQGRWTIHQAWFKVLCGFAAVGLIYGFFFHERNSVEAPVSPGWEGLIPCSYMASLDGKKELLLFKNHFARVYETTSAHKEPMQMLEGTWSFDEGAQLYSVTLDGVTTKYAIIRPQAANFCMLINGNLETANLSGSWFSSDVDPGDFDYGPERNISARY